MVLPLKATLPILAILIGDFHNKIGPPHTCTGRAAAPPTEHDVGAIAEGTYTLTEDILRVYDAGLVR
jgi:hypothetical protein